MKAYIIRGNVIASIFLLYIQACFSQEDFERPSFPDVFQTEVQGLFIEIERVVETDGSIYFDRRNNRAVMLFTFKKDDTKLIYNFETNQFIYINAGDCTVNDIPDQPEMSYFPFEIDEKKNKKMLGADEVFFFKNTSTLQRQSFEMLPTLVYTTTSDIPLYNRKNCDISHVFSKPDIEMADCDESHFCKSTLMTMSVNCRNEDTNETEVDHVYSFYRFRSRIEDESVFLPPPECGLTINKDFPAFPSYFSFSFEIIEDPNLSESATYVFRENKKVWYDADHEIIRIDEYEKTDLMVSSRVFDLKSETGFSIISSSPSCTVGSSKGAEDFSKITTLPKIFFAPNVSALSPNYVGKRKVHGLNYQVWTLEEIQKDADAKIVEEVYFLEVSSPNEDPSKPHIVSETYLQFSHINIFTYETDSETSENDLMLVKHLAISDYETEPKEWAVFDVAPCFDHTHKRDFTLKLKGPSILKDSQDYRQVIQLFYEAIINVTGISFIRINELRGIFDGFQLVQVKGSILDNSKTAGWQKAIANESGMDGAIKLIKDAAAQGKLMVTVTKGKNKYTYTVAFDEGHGSDKENSTGSKNCYSGATMAAASLVLLLLGFAFGIAGYYVFLKKRRAATDTMGMHYVQSDG